MISIRNIIVLGILILLNIPMLFSNDSIRCSSAEIFKNQVAQNPSLLIQQQTLENQIQKWIATNNTNRLSATQEIITIPVVVHVVYNTNEQNISDAQILSQINVLNKDFRNLNADKLLSSHPYYNLTGDANMEFCLAKIDPNGNATTGITRTFTTEVDFNGNPGPPKTNEKIKFTSKGGKDNWDPTQYLNIWVGKLRGSVLGYAQFPSEFNSEPATDGVVIDYKSFGTTGTLTANYNLGRTATHEIGHWLNLNHIWGDDSCGDDEVDDTPKQESDNSSCPTFPHITCANGPNGDMFMNYMDYTYDGCMSLFTKGQIARMTATLNTARSSIKTANKCSSTTGIIQQQLEQIKIYPNPIQHYLTIEGLPKTVSRNYNVDIINILGEKVYSTILENTQVQLEMQNLVKGTYIMNIYNDEFSFMQKLVVVK